MASKHPRLHHERAAVGTSVAAGAHSADSHFGQGHGRELLQSPAYKRCVGSFNQAGAEAGLRKRVPSCVNFNLQKCCAETKATLNGGNFQGCLCDKEVSTFLEGRLSKAGIAGLNANTFSVFLKTCGIPNAKTGGC